MEIMGVLVIVFIIICYKLIKASNKIDNAIGNILGRKDK